MVNVVSAMEVVYVMSLEVYVLTEYDVEKETSLIPVEEETESEAEDDPPDVVEANHQMWEVVTSPLDRVTVSVVSGSSHAREDPVEEAAVVDKVVVVFVLSFV